MKQAYSTRRQLDREVAMNSIDEFLQRIGAPSGALVDAYEILDLYRGPWLTDVKVKVYYTDETTEVMELAMDNVGDDGIYRTK